MTGDRVYRKGMTVKKSVSILEEEKDSGQWDPELIREFIGLINDEENARRIHAEDKHLKKQASQG